MLSQPWKYQEHRWPKYWVLGPGNWCISGTPGCLSIVPHSPRFLNDSVFIFPYLRYCILFVLDGATQRYRFFSFLVCYGNDKECSFSELNDNNLGYTNFSNQWHCDRSLVCWHSATPFHMYVVLVGCLGSPGEAKQVSNGIVLMRPSIGSPMEAKHW